MKSDDLAKLIYKKTLESQGVPFNEEDYEKEKAKSYLFEEMRIQNQNISKVAISIIEEYEETPDTASGFFMVDSVKCYDKDGKLMKDILYEKLINFHQDTFHSGRECIASVAKRLGVDRIIVEIV